MSVLDNIIKIVIEATRLNHEIDSMIDKNDPTITRTSLSIRNKAVAYDKSLNKYIKLYSADDFAKKNKFVQFALEKRCGFFIPEEIEYANDLFVITSQRVISTNRFRDNSIGTIFKIPITYFYPSDERNDLEKMTKKWEDYIPEYPVPDNFETLINLVHIFEIWDIHCNNCGIDEDGQVRCFDFELPRRLITEQDVEELKKVYEVVYE